MITKVVHPLGFAVAAQIPAQLAVWKRTPRFSIRGSNLNASGTHDKDLYLPIAIGFGQGQTHCRQAIGMESVALPSQLSFRGERVAAQLQ
jgi:hypothetical protein